MGALLHPDRLFPAESEQREIARRIYRETAGLPLVCPHGHTDPAWFARNERFPNPVGLLLTPDHYLLRMLYSQGIALEDLGLAPNGAGTAGSSPAVDPRASWRLFAAHYYLFRGTPSRIWLDWVFEAVFELEEPLGPDTADLYYDRMDAALARPEFLPRALYERFNIEVISTTDSPLDFLEHHRTILDDAWPGSVVPCFRPDDCLDPEREDFAANVARLGELTGEDTTRYPGYLAALRARREFFKSLGATSTDHGHPSSETFVLDRVHAARLFEKALSGGLGGGEADVFRGHMLVEMARMSLDDRLVMQLHPGSYRNHNPQLFQRFGRDRGADIPVRMEFTKNLKPLLDEVGNEKDFTLILFTLDETAYARELAPLAGHYPCLKLGPSWWFHDSPEGMRRFREQITETAGFYNTVGFNDDTRAFFSIPARHDVARRMDAAFLARLVAEHRLREDEALEVARDLAYNLAKKAYRL